MSVISIANFFANAGAGSNVAGDLHVPRSSFTNDFGDPAFEFPIGQWQLAINGIIQPLGHLDLFGSDGVVKISGAGSLGAGVGIVLTSYSVS